jgi:GAF domain-containing protein
MPAVGDPRPSAVPDPGLNVVAGAIGRLAEAPPDTDATDRVLWAATGQALSAAPGIAGRGLTVLRDGTPMSIMCERAPFSRLEEVQYAADTGPVPVALREHRVVAVDTRTARSWAPYAFCAEELGVRSCLVVPLSAAGEVLGSLNLYATDPDADLRAAVPIARLAADLASTALAAVARHAAMAKLAEELRTALESRAVIEQAKGLLMARGTSDGEAFARLRKLSQNHNIKLREVAALVVDLARP